LGAVPEGEDSRESSLFFLHLRMRDVAALGNFRRVWTQRHGCAKLNGGPADN
jgi:hypothetical protein